MRNFKLHLVLVSLMFSIHLSAQGNFELPFFDDFEETISDDATFTKWTTENLEGWHYWHIIPWNGNPRQCMRFENTDIAQDDWLITKQINCAGAENLRVNFSHFYHASKLPPKLYYTAQYNVNASQSTWKELSYSFGTNENQWYQSDDIIIENPGNVICFAFHYQAAANEGTYFLIDNFSVKNYTSTAPFVLVGSTEHFDFYTDIADESNYWMEIKDALEANYRKYCGHWNIPGLTDFMNENVKTKVYFTEKGNISYVDENTPEWKSGFFDRETKTIFLSPLNNGEKLKYYKSLTGLAIHTYAGYAHKQRLYRDRNGLDYQPEYYTEAFGLYEAGYRPNRDSIISYLSKHPVALTHDDLNNLKRMHNTSEKDIAVSYVEAQIILYLGYRWSEAPYGSFPPIWNNYLKYFYNISDVEQIKKYGESKFFDIYCSSRDTMNIDSMKVWLERTRQFYVDSFQMEINVRYPLLVMYDEQTGMDLTGYGNFNGGAGSINISPHNFYDGIEGYPWLLAHEFGHVFNNLMYSEFPFGFYHEGMANFSGYKLYGADWMEGKWKVNAVLDYYQQKYNRAPTLAEFAENPENKIDPYFFGLQFIRYLTSFNSLLTIKEFFNRGLDFSVFNKPIEDIEKGYISYLRSLVSSSVNQNFDESEFSIYPTLTRDVVNVEGDVKTIDVFSLTGQKVNSLVANGTKTVVNMSNLSSGAYIIRANMEDGSANMQNVILQK